jgi:hypothetical protein
LSGALLHYRHCSATCPVIVQLDRPLQFFECSHRRSSCRRSITTIQHAVLQTPRYDSGDSQDVPIDSQRNIVRVILIEPWLRLTESSFVTKEAEFDHGHLLRKIDT